MISVTLSNHNINRIETAVAEWFDQPLGRGEIQHIVNKMVDKGWSVEDAVFDYHIEMEEAKEQ